jgi:hypothetical protein
MTVSGTTFVLTIWRKVLRETTADDPSVDAAITSQQAKYGHFTGCAATAAAFALAPK